MAACDSTPQQQWFLDPSGLVVNKGDSMCLTTASASNKAQLSNGVCDPANVNQQWTSPGAGRLVLKANPGMSLDVPGGVPTLGAPASIWPVLVEGGALQDERILCSNMNVWRMTWYKIGYSTTTIRRLVSRYHTVYGMSSAAYLVATPDQSRKVYMTRSENELYKTSCLAAYVNEASRVCGSRLSVHMCLKRKRLRTDHSST